MRPSGANRDPLIFNHQRSDKARCQITEWTRDHIEITRVILWYCRLEAFRDLRDGN